MGLLDRRPYANPYDPSPEPTLASLLGNDLGINGFLKGTADWWSGMRNEDKAAIITTPIPIVGDIMGAYADATMYADDPESRTPLNFGLSAVGLLPFIPAAATIRGFGGAVDFAETLSKKYPDITGAITEGDGVITLNKLVVDKANRGQGIGSDFMADLTKYADDTGQQIRLTAAGDFGGSTARQKKFYKQSDFVENKGRHKDYSFSDNMYREPSTPTKQALRQTDNYPRKQAFDTAQKNASLPVSQGGLGLPADNTAMDRARAMGFDVDNMMYHGSQSDIDAFKESNFFKKATYFSPNEKLANQFSNMRVGESGGNVTPAFLRTSNKFDSNNIEHLDRLDGLLKARGDDFIEDAYGNTSNVIEGVRRGNFNMVEDSNVLEAMDYLDYDSFYIRESPEGLALEMAGKESRAFNDADSARTFYDEQLSKWERLKGSGTSKPKVSTVDGGYLIEFNGENFDGVKNSQNYYRNTGVLDPKNIRSPNAAFDPMKRNSSDLLSYLNSGLLGNFA